MRKIKAWDVEDSLDISNIQCPICQWYTNYAVKDDVTGEMVCASCADDILYMMTGCRFGTPGCDHEDCIDE